MNHERAISPIAGLVCLLVLLGGCSSLIVSSALEPTDEVKSLQRAKVDRNAKLLPFSAKLFFDLHHGVTLMPGYRIDIAATVIGPHEDVVTEVILQGVPILAVRQQSGNEAGLTEFYEVVTLGLTAEEKKMIAVASRLGTLHAMLCPEWSKDGKAGKERGEERGTGMKGGRG